MHMGLFSPIIRQYIEKVATFINGDVLDVGCGDKPYRSVFVNAKSYIGVDRPSVVDGVRSNITERKKVIDVIGFAESLPFHSGSFDVVIATQLIEHLAHPDLFFKESSRVLRLGGLLIVTFPMVGTLHEEPYDYFRYTEHGVKILCFDCGLQVERIEKMGGGWLTVGYLMRDFLHKNAAATGNWLWSRCLRSMGSFMYDVLIRLDKYDKHPEGVLNYMIIARK
jgi:SAM-dependent methyltransferase